MVDDWASRMHPEDRDRVVSFCVAQSQSGLDHEADYRALAADGFDGFFSMEPHLSSAHHLGGFSGPENFTRATEAFTALLDAEQISYR